MTAIEARLAEDDETTLAVLCRARNHLADLLPALRARGISWQASDIDTLADRPVVLDLLALYELLLQPRLRLAWFTVLRAPFFGLTLTELTTFATVEDIGPALENSEYINGTKL